MKISELAKRYENEEESGINIEVAKQILREEDKFDKQRFREKIKEKHREEKRKLKASKKVERNDEQDKVEDNMEENLEENMDDHVNDSEHNEPDLTWLPDPDKIYGKQQKDDENSDSSETQESEEENKKHRYACFITSIKHIISTKIYLLYF